MSNYIYINLLDKGYKQFKLTSKQHNSFFKYRKKKWYHRYEYYYNDKQIILHRFSTIPVIILETLLFPIHIFMVGFSEAKSTVGSLYNEKERGHFVSDNISYKSELYSQIVEIIN